MLVAARVFRVRENSEEKEVGQKEGGVKKKKSGGGSGKHFFAA